MRVETDQEREQREYREFEAKNVAFYQTILQAYISTSDEKDKSLRNISVSAIGLITTLVVAKGFESPLAIMILAVGYCFSIYVVFMTLQIHKLNKMALKQYVEKPDAPEINDLEAKMRMIDRATMFCFVLSLSCFAASVLVELFLKSI